MKEEYVSPEIRVVECHVESGFEISDIPVRDRYEESA